MTFRSLISTLPAIFIIVFAALFAQAQAVPKFADHPAATHFSGAPAKPRLAKGTLGWTLRTRIREGAADGPNFAGEWTLVSIGAGTANQVNFLVNARDGRVLDAPQSSLGVIARVASRLLVVNDPDEVKGYGDAPPDYARTRYYVFDGESFRELN